MARVSIEDCLVRIQNRFDLVLLAAERTKQIMKGAPPLVEAKDNKEVVTALREIAAGKVQRSRPSPVVEEETAEGKLPSA
ncbi:MAG: DNA-directed RNA polymerase subunit omega [Deltaproteobacteria bacterium RBG_13_65_10]|jgi:DNA-directed RNA polymerase subunit omega|nr:MAG: DNA-directed RNA polymerase subunit omega [Deltaproteobacteria bacterium RBG_13_65_10]